MSVNEILNELWTVQEYLTKGGIWGLGSGVDRSFDHLFNLEALIPNDAAENSAYYLLRPQEIAQRLLPVYNAQHAPHSRLRLLDEEERRKQVTHFVLPLVENWISHYESQRTVVTGLPTHDKVYELDEIKWIGVRSQQWKELPERWQEPDSWTKKTSMYLYAYGLFGLSYNSKYGCNIVHLPTGDFFFGSNQTPSLTKDEAKLVLCYMANVIDWNTYFSYTEDAGYYVRPDTRFKAYCLYNPYRKPDSRMGLVETAKEFLTAKGLL